MPIVVVGNVFVDVKGFPDEVYIPEGRNSGRVITAHGGVARNVAEDIANVELRPRFVSMVDTSGEGSAVRRKLKDHKVDTDFLITEEDGMGMWLAVFDHTGDLVAAISKRPRMEPMIELLEKHGDEIFSDADSIVIEIDLHKEIVKQTFKYAEKYSVPVIAVVANMSIASERRDFLTRTDCFVCNAQEAGILFVEDYSDKSPEELCDIIAERIRAADIKAMIVTLGSRGAVYATADGEKGVYPAQSVNVRDTTGAGDAFCAGVSIGLTYGKTIRESVAIGTRLAASVIKVSENTCPRFRPSEFGIDVGTEETEE